MSNISIQPKKPVKPIYSVSDNYLWTEPDIHKEDKKFPLTEQRCLKIGGHCWIMDNEVYLTNPPIYIRHCKHCGKRQEGRSQDPVNWEDI